MNEVDGVVNRISKKYSKIISEAIDTVLEQACEEAFSEIEELGYEPIGCDYYVPSPSGAPARITVYYERDGMEEWVDIDLNQA